ncbi:hypothetical protein Pelo_7068 [Pelomyxa schiedti]|nr:hypothetical protein Pelo_7068 [Pelomyxa schiedti]
MVSKCPKAQLKAIFGSELYLLMTGGIVPYELLLYLVTHPHQALLCVFHNTLRGYIIRCQLDFVLTFISPSS